MTLARDLARDYMEAVDGHAHKHAAEALQRYDETIGRMNPTILATCVGPKFVTIYRMSLITLLTTAFLSGVDFALAEPPTIKEEP